MKEEYCIIASHGENYVLATLPDGPLFIPEPEYLETLRAKEVLVGFETLLESLRLEIITAHETIPFPDGLEYRFHLEVLGIFANAKAQLGNPPMSEVDLHTTPSDITQAIQWDEL